MPELGRKLTAEALGAFAIVFVGVLSITGGGLTDEGSLVSISLAFGLIVAAMVASMSAVSGAHFNPAVSIAMLLLGRLSPADTLAYIAGQCAGAAAASFLLLGMGGEEAVAGGVCGLASGLSPLHGFVLELLGTGLLMIVILGSAVDPRAARQNFPLSIGLSISAIIFAIGPLTGAALNPARALGPALAAGNPDMLWLYLGGPTAGAVLAALLMCQIIPALRQRDASANDVAD